MIKAGGVCGVSREPTVEVFASFSVSLASRQCDVHLRKKVQEGSLSRDYISQS